MKKTLQKLRDTFIAGIIFLLPLLLLIVLLTKVFQFLTGFTAKIASWFGLKSFVGISGGTIVSALSLIILCIICGYMVRISFFKSVSTWIDKKMTKNIPGYSVYREMALSKLEDKEEVIPYKSAAWINTDNKQQPGFLMETMPDGKFVIFIPTAGNIKEGAVFTVASTEVQLCTNTDMKAFRTAINNMGAGLSKF
jgi:uncharacterized membrane protein